MQELEKKVGRLKRAKALLRKSEEKFRLVAENTSDIIWTMDLNERFTFVSPSVKPMLGYSVDEINSLNLKDLLTPASYALVQDCLKQGMNRGNRNRQAPLTLELEVLHNDGSIRWCEVTNRILWDSRGYAVNILGIARDITPRKNLREQFYHAHGRMVGGFAHDINNLLTVVISHSDFILSSLDDNSPIRLDIEEIGRAGKLASQTVQKLMAFSRRQVIKLSVVNLNETVSGISRMFSRVIGEDIHVRIIPDPSLWHVEVDVGQIEQVIMNLVVNARDAMPKGGVLTLKTANVKLNKDLAREDFSIPRGQYVMLTVSDTGIGMNKQIQSRIFDPFYTTKQNGKGTGLGLSTVYGIVKQSEGYIVVSSRPGQGTTFRIYLARAERAEAETAFAFKEQDISLNRPSGSETIMVVEDEGTVLNVVRRILQAHEYTILEAQNGEEAIKIGERYKGPIHLLVTDIVMPGISGFQLATHLKALRKEMRVLYMTGYAEDVISRHGIPDEEINLLKKPFTQKELLRKVKEILSI